MTRPLLLVDPWPRDDAMIFTAETRRALEARAEIQGYWGEGRMPDAMLEARLAEAVIIIGQSHLDAERIARAPKLRAVINVKGNWEPTVDYAALQARGVPMLSIAPCMAPAVAEWCLGAAIDLGRGITFAHERFRAGEEAYGIRGNSEALSLLGADVGLVGFGNLGRALLPLLRPFGGTIRVFDPWLPDGYLRDQGLHPSALDALLRSSRFLFLLAGVTSENEGFLSEERLRQIGEDACVVLASRAEIVDFSAFVRLAEAQRFRAAIDVFPEEPVPAAEPVRATRRILLSAHRAGGIRASYRRIAEWMAEDVALILDGLPPVRLQRADPATAALMRSR